jgi:hypothetical protein
MRVPIRVRIDLVPAQRIRAPQPNDVWHCDGRLVVIVDTYAGKVCYRNRETNRKGSSSLAAFRERFQRFEERRVWILGRTPNHAATPAMPHVRFG